MTESRARGYVFAAFSSRFLLRSCPVSAAIQTIFPVLTFEFEEKCGEAEDLFPVAISIHKLSILAEKVPENGASRMISRTKWKKSQLL